MIETPDDPVAAARAAGLRYTPDIGPGITRRRAGKGWIYIDPDGAIIRDPEELQRIYGLRRAMQGLGPIESMEMLITRLKKTKSNAEFLLGLSRT